VLAAIIAEPGLNPLELADRAGVSERTLRRDLAQLRELGYEVAYTSGYEVQEKLDLEGRPGRRARGRGDDQLLQAVAQAIESAGLWRGAEPAPAGPRRRRKSGGLRPLVLIPTGEQDADFIYATGFSVEAALYIRFGPDDEILAVSPLELDRAREESRIANVLEDRETYASSSWALLAARMLRDRGITEARVSPNLRAAHLEDLRAAGMDVEVDRDLFVDERRRKSPEEAAAIQDAQRAAEQALVEVVRELARADIKDGLLWLNGAELTSEHLYARAQLFLGERGFTCPDMIIAGSPDSALPHSRGHGPIKANAPVIIDIFPTSRRTHYSGDLTRTVVVGEVPREVQDMHAAVSQAVDAGIESIAAGVSGREVHWNVCQVLVDRGFGTTSKGYEGPDGVAVMNHSTGHGIGLDIHEEPKLRETETQALREGDVVTVEPGLYRLGFGGVRIEDTGMVTANGFKNFTSLPRSLDPRDYL
jgi:Xaa-Pro aminopeptidase